MTAASSRKLQAGGREARASAGLGRIAEDFLAFPSAMKELDGGRVFSDADVLNTGLSRTLYVGESADFAIGSRPHRHRSVHYFYCIHGRDACLAVQTGEDQIKTVRMRPGSWYFVPSHIAHQFKMRGRGAVEAYAEKDDLRDAMLNRANGGTPVVEIIEGDMFGAEDDPAA